MKGGAPVFTGSLLFLASTAAMSLAPGSGGSIAAAAFTLGGAAGPGSPLEMLLGRAMSLLPLGEVATRQNLLSALATAATAWLVDRIVRRLTGQAGPATALAGGVAALLYLLQESVFRQGTASSGEAVVWLPSAVCLALALRVASGEDAATDSSRAGLAAWLSAGIALATRAPAAHALVLVLALVTGVRLRRGDRWPLFSPLALCVGLLLLFALPASGAKFPGWDAPHTLGALVTEIGLSSSNATSIAASSWPTIGIHLAHLAAIFERQLGLPALLAAAFGLTTLFRRKQLLAALLLAGLFVTDVLATALLDPDATSLSRGGLPTAFVLAVAAGLALFSFASLGGGPANGTSPASRVSAAPIARGLALAAILLVPTALGGGHAPARGEAAAWTRAALAQAPARALILLRASTDLEAGLLYENAVAGRRPDVTVLVRDRLFDAARVANEIRRAGGMALGAPELAAFIALPERARRRAAPSLLGELVANNLEHRAVLWQPGPDHPPAGALSPAFPLFRLDPHPPGPAPAAAPLPDARLLTAQLESLLGPHPDDARLRLVAATARADLASALLALGDEPRALALAEAAAALAPNDSAVLLVLAETLAPRHPESALVLLDRVLSRDPGIAAAWITAGRLHLRLSDAAAAERDFHHARVLLPDSPAPVIGLARVAHARGDDSTARRLADDSLTLAPDSPEARALAHDLGME